MAAKKPVETLGDDSTSPDEALGAPEAAPAEPVAPEVVTPDELPHEPEAVDLPRGAIVRALMHLDDGADTGKYYRPGAEITGWTDEKIARMEAAGIVTVEAA